MKHLADKPGVSDSYANQMQAGDKIPNGAMLVKIADVFNVTLDQLARDDLEIE